MAEIIRMPRLSDTMEEGNIVAWLKKVGDAVSPGDILAEVETDKATMELESFFEGTLLYIGVSQGPVAVDGVIAIIGNKGEDYKSILENANAGSAPASGDVSSLATGVTPNSAKGSPGTSALLAVNPGASLIVGPLITRSSTILARLTNSRTTTRPISPT